MTPTDTPTAAPLTVALDLRLAAYRGGGIARYAVELARALRDVPGVRVLPVRSRRDLAPEPGALRAWTPPHHRLEALALGAELALRRRPDVFHATDFIAPRLRGVPVVATVHDLAFLRWPADLTAAARDYYGQLASARGRTARWITPSRWTADELIAAYGAPPERVHVIPHGAPERLLAAPLVPRAGRGGYALAVGTVEPRKRYELLLDAWQGDGELPRLLVVGAPGWNTAALQARLRATPGVEWRSDVTDDELDELYQRAVAVLLPSRAEGFGLPALEAMAAGTPVVSSDGGALPEVTGDAALAPAATPTAWGAAVRQLTEDAALWGELAERGRRRAATFTWQRAAAATAAVYKLATLRS